LVSRRSWSAGLDADRKPLAVALGSGPVYFAVQLGIGTKIVLKVAELEKRYAEMSDDKFTSIRRKDLVDAARPYYDREARRRGLPETVSEAQGTEIPQHATDVEASMSAIPTPEARQILREADMRRNARRRELVGLANMGKASQGPWNIVNIYRTVVIPADHRGDKLIVWLRRFHVKRRGGLRFNELLVTACQGLGFPLTVQDSTFKSSDAEVAPRFIPYLFLWSIWLTATLAGLGEQFPMMWVISYLGGGVPLFLMFLLGERIGYRSLDNPLQGREQTLHLIQEIRERRGKHGDDSVLILRCQDPFWRDIVQVCLKNASAAVIDVTEVSENVIWELKTALHLMAPQSIILACGLGAGDAEELPEGALVALAAELGADGPSRVQQFFYPQLKDQIDFNFSRWGAKESLEEDLRTRLAIAVAYSQNQQIRSSDRNS
jgi:hypothetical protein